MKLFLKNLNTFYLNTLKQIKMVNTLPASPAPAVLYTLVTC